MSIRTVLLRLRGVDNDLIPDITAMHSGTPYIGTPNEKPEAGLLYTFTDVKSVIYDNDGLEAQVDIRLKQEFDAFGVFDLKTSDHASDMRQVTREMLDPLWDLLGIFPRAVPKANTELATVAEEVSNIKILADGIVDDHYGGMAGIHAKTAAHDILKCAKAIEQAIAKK